MHDIVTKCTIVMAIITTMLYHLTKYENQKETSLQQCKVGKVFTTTTYNIDILKSFECIHQIKDESTKKKNFLFILFKILDLWLSHAI